jgi:hypothetical protein
MAPSCRRSPSMRASVSPTRAHSRSPARSSKGWAQPAPQPLPAEPVSHLALKAIVLVAAPLLLLRLANSVYDEAAAHFHQVLSADSIVEIRTARLLFLASQAAPACMFYGPWLLSQTSTPPMFPATISRTIASGPPRWAHHFFWLIGWVIMSRVLLRGGELRVKAFAVQMFFTVRLATLPSVLTPGLEHQRGANDKHRPAGSARCGWSHFGRAWWRSFSALLDALRCLIMCMWPPQPCVSPHIRTLGRDPQSTSKSPLIEPTCCASRARQAYILDHFVLLVLLRHAMPFCVGFMIGGLGLAAALSCEARLKLQQAPGLPTRAHLPC